MDIDVKQETARWNLDSRAKLLGEGNGAKEENENKNGRKYVLSDKYTVALMEWCCQSLRRRKRGGYAAKRELFSGIAKLDGIGEFKNEGWSRGTSREYRRLHEVSGMLDVPTVQRHWNVSLIGYSPSPFFFSTNLNHRNVSLSKLVNW